MSEIPEPNAETKTTREEDMSGVPFTWTPIDIYNNETCNNTTAKAALVYTKYGGEPYLAVVWDYEDGKGNLEIWEQRRGFPGTGPFPGDAYAEESAVGTAEGVHDQDMKAYDEVQHLSGLASDMWKALNGRLQDLWIGISSVEDEVKEYNENIIMFGDKIELEKENEKDKGKHV